LTDDNGNVVETAIFDANGNQLKTTSFSFTFSKLKAGQKYTYSVAAMSFNDYVIEQASNSVETKSANGTAVSQATKDADTNEVKVSVFNKNVAVNTSTAQNIAVYSITSKLIGSASNVTAFQIDVPAQGIYIVKAGNNAKKIVVR
jgi:hypothetical protein